MENINHGIRFDLGEAIIAARKRMGMKQEELAKRSNISQPNISLIERGKANPSLLTIARIADALHTKFVFDFMEYVEEDDAYNR